ncbi:hypothetical protein WR25_10678 [Diploscapter pachys]|uniref:Phosphomevalonate kinase n=1 Tax=Diploscapter pachys TaxID=2018661 RepID=A0A2A2LJH3_9BILA|nr:hypothetical protein WR25_10678 [Diploscapter pachys]
MVKLIVAISGKRKSGKDFVAKRLAEKLRQVATVHLAGVSHSLKQEYAQIHDLNYDELLTDGPEKEQHRRDMIEWGEQKRKQDAGYFCRKAVSADPNCDICIITDCRRTTDMEFFKNYCKTLAVRIDADLEVRKSRGYIFFYGIDDAESECGLDDYKHDFVLQNNGDDAFLEKQMGEIFDICKTLLSN